MFLQTNSQRVFRIASTFYPGFAWQRVTRRFLILTANLRAT